eukprot:PhF_6_TR8080/c0_g1_i1/m.12500/K02887/RP-L20, MRPL20, rplT; large subunit ribosomal protein L20
MFRSTPIAHHYNGKKYLFEIASMMTGRARHERKLGHRYIRTHLRVQSNYRAYAKDHFDRARVRSNLQAAYMEHGTDYPKARNDLSRQKILLDHHALSTLAIQEPLAFRSVMELISSGVAPPPRVEHTQLAKSSEDTVNEAVQVLCDSRYGNPVSKKYTAETLKDAWKQFQ